MECWRENWIKLSSCENFVAKKNKLAQVLQQEAYPAIWPMLTPITQPSLGLSPQNRRRPVWDLIMCYKIIFGIVRVNRDEFFEFTLSRTRGHPFKLLYKHFTSCSDRSSFFSERVINCWNRLPIDTVDFSSLAKFKRCIDTVITTVFIRDT